MTDSWKNGIIICDDPAASAAAAAKLDPQIRTLLEANKPEAVEELLLGRISESPLDLRFFIPALRHFVKNKKPETAGMFFEFLVEACRTRKAEQEELSLLRALLLVWPEALPVRTNLLEHLRTLYADTPNFDVLVEHCRVLESPEPLPAFRMLENWLRFNEGRVVYMGKKGAGRVREINCTLGTVRVVFQDNAAPLSFKLDEAVRLLEPLRSGHFLVDKIDRPEELQRLAISDSGELLRRLFVSLNRQLPLNELRDMLSGIVQAQQWSAWWQEVRKDRRLTISPANLCTWNDSAENADTELLNQFTAASVRDRIEMVRKHAHRSTAIASAMIGQLLKDAENERSNNPALSFELLLTLQKYPAAAGGNQKSRLVEFINHADVAEFVRALQDRTLKKQALTLIRECNHDWPALFARLIRTESDMQSVALMYDSMRSKNAAFIEGLVAETMSSPVKTPDFFVWLCREMNVRPELQRFANWNFLQSIMKLLANNSLKEQQSTLRKLFDDDGAFHQAARRIDPEQAKQLIALLERDSALEDYRRDMMLKDLRAWYPQTQEVVDKTFYVSAGALKMRKDEFVKLTTVDIPQNTEEIIKARAHGDLRENFEYHAARTRQEMLSSRAKTLHDELQFARPIIVSQVDPSTACIGTSVRLSPSEGGASLTITILGPWDSDPDRNVISYLAPAAKALLGKRKEDRVSFNKKSFSIEEINVAVWE
jgi:transcription elongation GreA/GreB family factor